MTPSFSLVVHTSYIENIHINEDTHNEMFGQHPMGAPHGMRPGSIDLTGREIKKKTAPGETVIAATSIKSITDRTAAPSDAVATVAL